MRGCFVTGTGTGVGKSVVTAAIVACMRARGYAVRALKPVITGLDEPPASGWGRDHELLAAVAGCTPDEAILAGYGPAVSPHLAAELSGRRLHPDGLCRGVLATAAGGEVLVVEGVGGLLVPLADGYDVRDLAGDLGLPVVVAARPGLGTLNHTLLTLEAARGHGLEVAGVVLTPWPPNPDLVARSNRTTIERLGGVSVSTLAEIARAEPALLAAAARDLPLERWLA